MAVSSTTDRPVVLITGASSGLGAGMALEFAAAGCDLALCARRRDRLESLSQQIHQATPAARVEVLTLDVNDHPAVEQVFDQFDQCFGRIDRIIVNAGVGTGVPVGKGGMQQNVQVAQTNFTAALVQAEAAMKIFRARKAGHLVFMSSMSAMRGMRGTMTAYAASKAGVSALAEGLRVETLNKPDICVSTLYPGYIRTEMNEHIPAGKTPFMIDATRGSRLLRKAIERRAARSYVPWWPWAAVGWLMRKLPLSLASRLT